MTTTDEIPIKIEPAPQKLAVPALSAKQQNAVSATGEKPKRKRGRPPSFKPTQFDFDLMHLLREGVNSADLILEQLGIAKSELFLRVDLLKNENLVKEENGEIKLTVNGYNFYSTKGMKKVSLKKAITGDVKLQKHKFTKPKELPSDAAGQKHVNDWLTGTEVVDLGGKLGKMDLQEIVARYGPSTEQKERFLQRKAMEAVQPKQELQPQPKMKNSAQQAQPQQLQPSRQQIPPAINSDESCDLCKSNFAMSVSNPALSKYGHCFCGAAYHKECYDSLLTDSSYCIRCGKKLLLIIDKQSRETIKGLRDVFE